MTSYTSWDASFTFDFGKYNLFLVGFESYHSNHREDRRFKFFFRRHMKIKMYSSSPWKKANSYDNPMNFKIERNQGIIAVHSYHSNHHEDREFHFKVGTINVS